MAITKKEFNSRPYMELAIEEMKKSLNEPRTDGKIPPKVGAIIVFPDGSNELAYRGELRDGDHAEFTLLERKLGGTKLDDCILFTTLEPCVYRTPPKLSCRKRTLKARIKTVFVGITDPDPTVDGKGIKYLEDGSVSVFMFDKDLQKIIEDENADFINQAKQRKQKKKEEDLLSSLEKPVSTANLDQFSDEALNKFIAEANLSYKISDQDFIDYLEQVGIVRFDEEDKIIRPTGIGIILFGKNPRARYKQAALMATVDYGGNVEQKTFDQPLVLLPDLVEEWLFKVLPLSLDTSSFKRKDISAYPINVLREAVINAIVHRDYFIEGAKVSIEIDNEKVIVKSPGSPLPSISLEQLNSFKAPTISRNPIITYIFSLMGYVEEKGIGMKLLRSLNEKFELPLPEYSFEEPFLSLIFPRNVESIIKVFKHPGLSELSPKELQGYEYVRLNGEISKKEYAEHFKYDDKKALRHLSKMKKLKLIGDNGETTNSPNYRYVFIFQ